MSTTGKNPKLKATSAEKECPTNKPEKSIADLTTDELLTLLEERVKSNNSDVISMTNRLTSISMQRPIVKDLIIAMLIKGNLFSAIQRTATDNFDPGIGVTVCSNVDGSIGIDTVDLYEEFFGEDEDEEAYDPCEGCSGCDKEEDKDEDEATAETDKDDTPCKFGMTKMDTMVDFFESIFGPLTCARSNECKYKNCRYHMNHK